MNIQIQNPKTASMMGGLLFLAGTCFIPEFALAQSGIGGAIDQAANEITKAIAPMMKLFYAVAAVIFIIGAIKVYSKWAQGDPDAQKTLVQYGVATIIVGILPLLLRGVFGIG